jgi:archaellum biogenesis ATPase FlaH
MEEEIEKIRRILIALGLEKKKIKFAIRRSELLDSEHVNISGDIKEKFIALHKKYNLGIENLKSYPVSHGELEMEKLLEFLKEYDKMFDLNYTVIDIDAIIINPSLL